MNCPVMTIQVIDRHMNTPDEETMIPEPESFLTRYCQKYHCPPEDFAVTVLWHCMHRLQKPLARLIWLYNADFFHSDLDLINQVKDATNYAKVREIVKFFSKEPSANKFTRRTLKVRISRSKLLKLAAAELGENPRKSGGQPAA